MGVVTLKPAAIKDNLTLMDEELAINELAKFKKAGGKTIVDPSTVDLGRNPKALRRIARAVNITYSDIIRQK